MQKVWAFVVEYKQWFSLGGAFVAGVVVAKLWL